MRGIVVAGTHSGCVKATVTMTLIAAIKGRGLSVQSFKDGTPVAVAIVNTMLKMQKKRRRMK